MCENEKLAYPLLYISDEIYNMKHDSLDYSIYKVQ